MNLLPCPFCGTAAAFKEADEGVYVCCTNPSCNASSHIRYPLMEYARPLVAQAWNRRTPAAPAAQDKKAEPYQVTIGGNGVLAGVKMTIDPSLPPDTIEWQGENRVRVNLKTGEITELAACRAPGGWKPAPAEPTEEMLVAAHNAVVDFQIEHPFPAFTNKRGDEIRAAIYRAMIAAAPTPEDPS